jgi:preprotein translocase subunit YajC
MNRPCGSRVAMKCRPKSGTREERITHMSSLLVTLMALAPSSAESGGLVSLLPIIAMVAIIYFLLIRPQQKEHKRHQQMVSSLKKGDEVVTTGGLYGRITALNDEKITLKVSDNTKLVVERGKIARVRESGKGE